MRILVITPGFLPSIGGAEIGVHEIFSRIGSRHNVMIMTPQLKNRAPVDGFDYKNYTVFRYRNFLDFGRLRGKRITFGVIPPFSVGTLVAARRLIPNFQPNVINIHYAAYSGLAAIWAQKVCNIPVVLSLVGRDAIPGPEVPMLWPRYSKLIATQVAHTIFVSNYCESFYRESHFPHSVIPYGVDTKKKTPRSPNENLLKRLEISRDASVLFSLQRLNKIKRIDFTIRSFYKLIEEGFDDVLLLIGGIGPEKSKLKELASNLGINDRVKFLGFIPEDQISDYFSITDIFISSSIFETFGIVLVQAMASGLPVIATRNSAIPEIVEHGVTGLLSPPYDEELFAKNIATLLTDHDLKNNMGITARQKALKFYDWNLIVKKYEGILSEQSINSS